MATLSFLEEEQKTTPNVLSFLDDVKKTSTD